MRRLNLSGMTTLPRERLSCSYRLGKPHWRQQGLRGIGIGLAMLAFFGAIGALAFDFFDAGVMKLLFAVVLLVGVFKAGAQLVQGLSVLMRSVPAPARSSSECLTRHYDALTLAIQVACGKWGTIPG
jgi:hypothetical protein